MSLISSENRKATGSYYTCSSVAEYIANRVIDMDVRSVLEPSFGDGSFLDAASKVLSMKGIKNVDLYGVELLAEPFNQYVAQHKDVEGFCIDFMEFNPDHKVDAVIGNPPFISLKNTPEDNRKRVSDVIAKYGMEMPKNGSMWMPFIIHATEMINLNGRIGFILPYEITYVRYAFKLWEYLGMNYGKISVLRVHDDFFPDVDVETIILLAEKRGMMTESIHYSVYDTLDDMFNGIALTSTTVKIYDILDMRKPFEIAMVSDSAMIIINKMRDAHHVSFMKKDCKFKIGYVAGNKKFFHPDERTAEHYGLKEDSLLPCIINAKDISRCDDIGLDAVEKRIESKLFCPQTLDENSKAYIDYGESIGINGGYKCRRREPWYIVPGIEIPDIILTVFGDMPRLLSNSGKYAVSNSLLCGTVSDNKNPKEIVCRWYNSLTLLLIEITIHSLGGGTLVLIPGETDRLELVDCFPEDKVDEIFSKLDHCALSSGIRSTYELGDDIVLRDIYGLSRQDISVIRNTLNMLKRWRQPDTRRG